MQRLTANLQPSAPPPISILKTPPLTTQSDQFGQSVQQQEETEETVVGDYELPGTATTSPPLTMIKRDASVSPPNTSSAFQVTTSTHVGNPCKVRLCICKCHVTSRAQPLAWVSGVFGSLFIGYSGVTLPFVGPVKCTEKSCQRTEKAIVKATYYFPNWTPFAFRMVSLYDSWNSFDGHQIHVKLPRVVPASAELFTLAQKGNIEGIQRLFSEKKASIYDINMSEGRSALHVSISGLLLIGVSCRHWVLTPRSLITVCSERKSTSNGKVSNLSEG